MSDILKNIKNSLKKELSTEEIQHLSEHLLHFLDGDHSEKEKKEARSLLVISEEKREENWKKDQELADEIFLLLQKAKKTKALLERLDPDAVEKKLTELRKEFVVLEKKVAGRSYFLDAELKDCRRMICRCDFYFCFAQAMLLDETSYEKNAAHLLKDMEKAFLQSSASAHLLWMQMPASFRSGIEKAGLEIFKKNFSNLEDTEKAYAVDIYYTDLQDLLFFAETFFYVSEEKALYQFHRLPMRIKKELLQEKMDKEQSLGSLVMQYLQQLVFATDE